MNKNKEVPNANYDVRLFSQKMMFYLNVALPAKVQSNYRFNEEDFLNRNLESITLMDNGESKAVLEPIIKFAEIASEYELKHVQVSWHKRSVLITLTFVSVIEFMIFSFRVRDEVFKKINYSVY